MKNILKIAILSIVLISCGNDDKVPIIPDVVPFEPQNIETEIILKSSLLHLYALTEFNHIIKNQNELDDILSEAEFDEIIKNRILTSIIDANIDFNQYQVLAVINPNVVGSGTTIDIISVTEYENEIKVVVENLNKGTPADVTFPYEIVKMPKIDKPVVFDTSLLWIP